MFNCFISKFQWLKTLNEIMSLIEVLNFETLYVYTTRTTARHRDGKTISKNSKLLSNLEFRIDLGFSITKMY